MKDTKAFQILKVVQIMFELSRTIKDKYQKSKFYYFLDVMSDRFIRYFNNDFKSTIDKFRVKSKIFLIYYLKKNMILMVSLLSTH